MCGECNWPIKKEEKMQWIKCSERLPMQKQDCLYIPIKAIPGTFIDIIVSGYFSGDQF